MNDIMTFANEQFGEIRSLLIDGEPWFVGKDVAEVLGYSNASKAVSVHVDDDDRHFIMWDRADSQNGNLPTGQSKTTIINESGLYSLILKSKLPSAKAFKRWVTSTVLPMIRKHGAYLTDDALEKALTSPEFGIKLLTELKAEKEKREQAEKEKKELAIENAFLSVKAKYYDRILSSTNSVPVMQIAKDYGMSAVAFNQMLYDYKIQFPIRKTWVLYAEYADKGYTQSKTFHIGEDKAVMHTYWTQKGRLFLYEFLKERGIIPLCEQEDYDDGTV